MYLRALDRYDDAAATRLATALNGPCPIRESIAAFLGRIISDIVSDRAGVTALSRHFTAGIQGLRLVGKANPDREALKDIAKLMLRALDV